MKTVFLLFICLFSALFINAQQIEQSSYFTQSNDNFQDFDKSSFLAFQATQRLSNQELGVNFSNNKQLPHYIIGGLSLGAVGIGLVQKSKSQDIYNNQYLTEVGEARAEPFYQEANNLHHQFIWLTSIGGGAFVINAAWYFIKKSSGGNGAISNIEITTNTSGTIGAGISLKF